MKKVLPWLFCGISLISIAVGIFKTEPSKAARADDGITISEDKRTTFGYYPQTIDYTADVDAILASTYDGESNYYTYNNQKYFIVSDKEVDREHEGFFNDQSFSSFYFDGQQKVAVKVEEIEWDVIKEGKGYVDLISHSIIERMVFDNNGKTDFKSSELCANLNRDFLTRLLFGETRKDKILEVDNYKVRIPSKSEWDGNGGYPSDYAIIKNLSSHADEYVYKAAPYWTSTKVGDRLTVRWMNKLGTTDCLPGDGKIGVRPVIRLQYGGGGGGGGSSSPNVNFTGNIPLLIIGFIFLAGGGTAIVIFMLKKGQQFRIDPKFKASWKYYLIIIILVSVTLTGCYMFASGTVLSFSFSGISGGKSHIYGLYVSCTYLDDDDGSEDWDWVDITHGVYALTKDGKVYHYIGNWPVGKEVIREDGEGSYTVKGNELTITFPDYWRTFSFEHSPMTYKIEKDQYWEVKLVLDYDVSFAEQVPPVISGSGVYNMNFASYAADHNPDGRPYYTKGELGY